MTATDLVPDSERTGLIGALPRALRPYASLMRHRPADRHLAALLALRLERRAWPGCAGEWALFLWFLLGAFAMRSAGCVYNDIVDRELDQQVERTRLRPLASGRISLRKLPGRWRSACRWSASSCCSSFRASPRASR